MMGLYDATNDVKRGQSFEAEAKANNNYKKYKILINNIFKFHHNLKEQ